MTFYESLYVFRSTLFIVGLSLFKGSFMVIILWMRDMVFRSVYVQRFMSLSVVVVVIECTYDFSIMRIQCMRQHSICLLQKC